jgi:hypothetical protein
MRMPRVGQERRVVQDGTEWRCSVPCFPGNDSRANTRVRGMRGPCSAAALKRPLWTGRSLWHYHVEVLKRVFWSTVGDAGQMPPFTDECVQKVPTSQRYDEDVFCFDGVDMIMFPELSSFYSVRRDHTLCLFLFATPSVGFPRRLQTRNDAVCLYSLSHTSDSFTVVVKRLACLEGLFPSPPLIP